MPMPQIVSGNLDSPVTTLPKLRAVGLDPAHFATCAPPNPQMGVRGCAQYKTCRLKFKNNGPQAVGVQLIYADGGRVDNVRNCWSFVGAHDHHISGGNVFRVVAYQGELFSYRTAISGPVDPKTGKRSRAREQTLTMTVPMWPEPQDNPDLQAALYNMRAFDDFKDEREVLQQAEVMANMTGTDPKSWMPGPPLSEQGGTSEATQGSWGGPGRAAPDDPVNSGFGEHQPLPADAEGEAHPRRSGRGGRG